MRLAMECWLGVTAFVGGAVAIYALQDDEAGPALAGAALAVGNAIFLLAMFTGAI